MRPKADELFDAIVSVVADLVFGEGWGAGGDPAVRRIVDAALREKGLYETVDAAFGPQKPTE